MASIKLSDGREVTIDLDQISISEFRASINPDQADADEYATLGKVSGLGAEEVANLSFNDYRRLTKAYFDAARKPLDDPNS